MITLFFLLIGAPRIEVVPPVFDAGEVIEGDTILAEFTIKNIGDKPLVIKRVRKTCGCITVDDYQKELSPGEKTVIKVYLYTKGFVENVKKPVYLNTNDPENPVTRVFIKAFVMESSILPKPLLTPDYFDLGELTQGEEKVFTLWLKNEGARDFIVLEVETPMGITLETKLPITVKTEKVKPVNFTLKTENLTPGIFEGKIVLRTNYKRHYKYEIPVVAGIKPSGIKIFSPLLLVPFSDGWLFYVFNSGKEVFSVTVDGNTVKVPADNVREIKIKNISNNKLRITIEVPIQKKE